MNANANTPDPTRDQARPSPRFLLAEVPWSDVTAVLTVVGLVGYLVGRAFIDGFSQQFAITAEEVGVSYGWLLSRLAVPYGYYLGLAILAWAIVGTAVLKRSTRTHSWRIAFPLLTLASLVVYFAFVTWLYQVAATSSVAKVSLELLLVASFFSIMCVVFTVVAATDEGSPGAGATARLLKAPATVTALVVIIIYLTITYAAAWKAGALTAGSIIQGEEVHRVGFDLHRVKVTGPATDGAGIGGQCPILLGGANSVVVLYDQAAHNVWHLPVAGVALEDDPFSSECPPR